MSKTNQEKLNDIWWILCAESGREYLAELVGGRAASKTLNTTIKRGGSAPGETSLAGMVAWNDDHVIQTLSAVAATAASGGANVGQIKDAVTQALKEGVVNVKVSVEGSK